MLDGNLTLGEIVVCPAYVDKICKEDQKLSQQNKNAAQNSGTSDKGVSLQMSKTFDVETRCHLLLTHGILHLMG